MKMCVILILFLTKFTISYRTGLRNFRFKTFLCKNDFTIVLPSFDIYKLYSLTELVGITVMCNGNLIIKKSSRFCIF